MPELPEVEAVCRRLRRDAVGAEIVSAEVYRRQMTAPQTARRVRAAVVGSRIEGVTRRGKNILVHLSGGRSLRVHLRMTGDMVVLPDARLRPLTVRLWFGLTGGGALALEDPRALGRVTVHETAKLDELLADLGPEPLSEEFRFAAFQDSAARTVKPMKIFLMDQKAVAGLGNIYAAEALFQAGIHPKRAARSVGAERLRRLYEAIKNVLGAALRSAILAYEKPGTFAEGELYPVAVYGREGEPCPACGGGVKRIPQGGRSTYYCPRCQR